MFPTKITRSVASVACALLLIAHAQNSRAEGSPANPHLREGCIDCHHDAKRPAGAGGTVIIDPGGEDPHAAVVHSCLACHKEGRGNFWIIMLPEGRIPHPPPAAAEPPPAPSAGEAAAEGFANRHDGMTCTSCHEESPRSLRDDLPREFPFGAGGVDVFCRRCHRDASQSHFPRDNLPRGDISCITCHQVHGDTPLYPSLRMEYPLILVKGTDFNPHGGRLFCLSCHRDTPEAGRSVTYREQGDITALCLRCHGELKEHHPTGVRSSRTTWKMDFADFPLAGDAITCATCHDPVECETGSLGNDPLFLRGGPYASQDDFCTRCHEGTAVEADSIHDQIDESGKPRPGKCLVCHADIPEGSEGFEFLEFTNELGALCNGCHDIAPHPHLTYQYRLPPKMIESVKKFEEQRLVTLPLEDEVFVTCVTCHNPHERGLLKGPAGVGADERKRLRLPTLNQICTPCHGSN